MASTVDALVAAAVDDPGTGLAVGTFGAIAEFLRPAGAATRVDHAERTHTAVTDGGAVRVTVPDDLRARAWRRPAGPDDGWSQAVALCLPAGRAAGPGRRVVTELGPDHDAITEGGVLVDLGLGVSHLEACVRTDDADLLTALRRAEGGALDGELTATLVAAGPPRVFRTVAARVEVTGPIPPPTGQSPAGPHTHLLPALLAHGRTHAATDPIPEGEAPVAMVFPPHPVHDQLGRPHPPDAAADDAFERVLGLAGDPDEVAWSRAVLAAVDAGEDPRPPPDLTRAGRRGWETALRRRAALGDPTRVAAWRALVRGTAGDAPFHETH